MARNKRKAPSKHRRTKLHVDEDNIVCAVCGAKLRAINFSHLKTHGLTTDQYREKYGVDSLYPVSRRRQISEMKRRKQLDKPYEPLSRDEIIANLKKYDKKHSPLSWEWLYSQDPSLATQTKRVFTEWPEALKAAGLEHCQLAPVRTKYQVAVALTAWVKQHGKLSYIRLQQTDRVLEGQVRFRYGSLEKAARSLKLPFERRYEPWTPEKVIRRIKKRAKSGGDLGMRASTEEDGALVIAATRRFGTWEAAVEAAGYDYETIRKTSSWTKKTVLKEIRRRRKKGKSLRGAHVCADGSRSLYTAGLTHFGSWRETIEAAGFDYESVRGRRWTDQLVLDEIRKCHKRGTALTAKAFKEDNHGGLVQAAWKRFGSWKAAVEAAGLWVPRTRK